MPITAGNLAERLQVKCLGSTDRAVTGVATLNDAEPGDLTFYKDTRSLGSLSVTDGVTVLISSVWAEKLEAINNVEVSWLLVEEPHTTFLELIPEFLPVCERTSYGISSSAILAASATVGESTSLMPGAVIEDDVVIGDRCVIHSGVVVRHGTVIGDDCVLHPNAVIYPGMVIHNRVIIHANCVIGADGFGYQQKAGRHEKIPHYGNVVIEDDVEIGAGSTIDRSFLGSTRIGTGTKIDNQVMIAHNCELGPHNIMVSQVGMAGSVTTGAYVICAGQVGIADHVHLGEGAVVGAKSGVHKTLAGGQTYLGAPAIPESEKIREVMAVKKLPEMRSQLKLMEKQLQKLQQQIDNDGTQSSAA